MTILTLFISLLLIKILLYLCSFLLNNNTNNIIVNKKQFFHYQDSIELLLIDKHANELQIIVLLGH